MEATLGLNEPSLLALCYHRDHTTAWLDDAAVQESHEKNPKKEDLIDINASSIFSR